MKRFVIIPNLLLLLVSSAMAESSALTLAENYGFICRENNSYEDYGMIVGPVSPGQAALSTTRNIKIRNGHFSDSDLEARCSFNSSTIQCIGKDFELNVDMNSVDEAMNRAYLKPGEYAASANFKMKYANFPLRDRQTQGHISCFISARSYDKFP
ncbi:MAG: hypothetical protein ACXVB1_10950 [Pseudobdellovibrionaceae bacterium]